MRRLADPYRDLDVIDSRAPRFNQAVIGTLAALAVATGWWWLLAVLAAQLWIGLSLGRRFCVPCLVYFQLIQPRLREGPLEDSRPPRFANLVGAVFLSAAAALYGAEINVVGAVLGGLVAGLALLAAATGFCTGCEAYKIGCRLLGRPFIACPVLPQPTSWANQAPSAVVAGGHEDPSASAVGADSVAGRGVHDGAVFISYREQTSKPVAAATSSRISRLSRSS